MMIIACQDLRQSWPYEYTVLSFLRSIFITWLLSPYYLSGFGKQQNVLELSAEYSDRLRWTRTMVANARLQKKSPILFVSSVCWIVTCYCTPTRASEDVSVFFLPDQEAFKTYFSFANNRLLDILSSSFHVLGTADLFLFPNKVWQIW